jgi:helicase
MDISELRNFGIDEDIISILKADQFEKLTKVQRLAVEAGLFSMKNIIVSAPTNTGKTFIGELGAIASSRRRERCRTFYLVPLKALADEKFNEFRRRYSQWGLSVAISTHDRTEFDNELMNHDLIIATYEKLNALIIRNQKLVSNIGLVIVDELQNIGDVTRGITLEVLITRLLVSPTQPQIIGLSATIQNPNEITEWTNAALVETKERDVELREGILFTGVGNINFLGQDLSSGDFIYREFNTGKIGIEKALAINSLGRIADLSKTEQSLIFDSTRVEAEKRARRIANSLPTAENATKLIEELDAAVEPTPSTRALKEILMNGVAFHHAGLLAEERRIIEEGFRDGIIRVVCCTTTLGAGVNTPAKNVLLLSLQNYEGNNISTKEYKNISGRAGRIRARDTFGRSVILAENKKELECYWNGYIAASPEPIESQLSKGTKLGTAILGLISCNICNTRDDLINFIKMSFFGYTHYKKSAQEFHKLFDASMEREVQELEKLQLVNRNDNEIEATEIGKRCAEQLLSPSTAAFFHERVSGKLAEINSNFSKMVQAILHLACNCDDAERALLFEPKSGAELEELEALWERNSTEFVCKPKTREKLIKTLRTSRMLMRWIEGIPYGEMRQYGPAGTLKKTAETVSWLLNGLANLVEKPVTNITDDAHEFILELSQMVYYGIPKDGLEIMKLNIPSIHRYRAKQLVDGGYNTLDKLIEAKVEDLARLEGIGEKLGLRIKKHIEESIQSRLQRSRQHQVRSAKELKRDPDILERLYTDMDDDFSRTIVEIFKMMGLDCTFIGDTSHHEVDALIKIKEGVITIESKRKRQGSVSATEAEEVLGKGAKYRPVAAVTIGYPDFSKDAAKNAANTKVTLVRTPLIGEILIEYWAGNLVIEDVISFLRAGKCVEDVKGEGSDIL